MTMQTNSTSITVVPAILAQGGKFVTLLLDWLSDQHEKRVARRQSPTYWTERDARLEEARRQVNRVWQS
jgi:hypothetical protein